MTPTCKLGHNLAHSPEHRNADGGNTLVVRWKGNRSKKKSKNFILRVKIRLVEERGRTSPSFSTIVGQLCLFCLISPCVICLLCCSKFCHVRQWQVQPITQGIITVPLSLEWSGAAHPAANRTKAKGIYTMPASVWLKNIPWFFISFFVVIVFVGLWLQQLHLFES